MPSENDQVKIRLSEEEAAALDLVRGASSRATYVKGVLSAALAGPVEPPMREPDLPPGQGPRAYTGRLMLFCEECRRRSSEPTWRCAEHPRKTVIQKNRPYLGIEIPTPEVEGLRVVDAGQILKG